MRKWRVFFVLLLSGVMSVGKVNAQMCGANLFMAKSVIRIGMDGDYWYGCDYNDNDDIGSFFNTITSGSSRWSDSERCICQCSDMATVLDKCQRENKYLVECGGEINYVCRSCPAGNMQFLHLFLTDSQYIIIVYVYIIILFFL